MQTEHLSSCVFCAGICDVHKVEELDGGWPLSQEDRSCMSNTAPV